mgnify:CR=1 FL=1|jgi:hypothetical protein
MVVGTPITVVNAGTDDHRDMDLRSSFEFRIITDEIGQASLRGNNEWSSLRGYCGVRAAVDSLGTVQIPRICGHLRHSPFCGRSGPAELLRPILPRVTASPALFSTLETRWSSTARTSRGGHQGFGTDIDRISSFAKLWEFGPRPQRRSSKFI